jgi:plasmid stabilization system protein ParE
MNCQVFITSRAKFQLAEFARWWAEHRDIRQAARWLDGFERAIAGLAQNPERHSFARENCLYQLPYPVRQMTYGIGMNPTHRAVFEIRGDIVFVVAIRHLAQDDLPSTEL